MKTMLIILAICLSQVVFSQQAKKQTIVIQTSAQCDDCKERIEGALNYTKGVKFADLDLETKKVSVQYKTKLINAQEIKDIIAKIGYDADEVKADAEAVSKLPKCCQPKGHPWSEILLTAAYCGKTKNKKQKVVTSAKKLRVETFNA